MSQLRTSQICVRFNLALITSLSGFHFTACRIFKKGTENLGWLKRSLQHHSQRIVPSSSSQIVEAYHVSLWVGKEINVYVWKVKPSYVIFSSNTRGFYGFQLSREILCSALNAKDAVGRRLGLFRFIFHKEPPSQDVDSED